MNSFLFLEEKSRVYSPWSCEVCTFINEPFIKTRKDVCEMCEGPSPLKRRKEKQIFSYLFNIGF
jgi:hypothetical protein